VGLGRPEVGPPLRILELFGETFELAAADVFEVAPVRRAGRLFVQEDRQREALGHGLCGLSRQRHAVRHRGALDRDERHHVHGAKPRVLALEGEDAAVVVLVRLDVEDAHAGDLPERRHHGRDHLGTPALADVRDGFDDLGHDGLAYFSLEKRRGFSA
jgi:hypothetical protein